jgi:hypothetical protein
MGMKTLNQGGLYFMYLFPFQDGFQPKPEKSTPGSAGLFSFLLFLDRPW